MSWKWNDLFFLKKKDKPCPTNGKESEKIYKILISEFFQA